MARLCQKNPPLRQLHRLRSGQPFIPELKSSGFSGSLDNESKELHEWAISELPLSIKFVTGDGGTGKSRLAAEFATGLQKDGWEAGFVDLRQEQSFHVGKEGTLMIIDYPEENKDGVTELLRDLSLLSPPRRLRILFLTRQKIDDWQTVLLNSNVKELVELTPIELGGLTVEDAYALYDAARKEAAYIITTNPVAITMKEMENWLSNPYNNRPLFILASAVYSALRPDERTIGYDAKDAVEAIVERELVRFVKASEGLGLNGYALARLSAMAAIADRLPIKKIKEFVLNEQLELGIPAGIDIEAKLDGAGLLRDRTVEAPKPDIVAAAFVVHALKQMPETAGELIWEAIKEDVKGGLERISRLSYDAETVLGIHDHRISRWLARGIKGKPDRCKMLDGYFSATDVMPLSWIEASIASCLTLLEKVTDDVEKARLLNNLGNSYSDLGRPDEALDAALKAVEIRKRLSAKNPDAFEPDLATSYGALGSIKINNGETLEAADAFYSGIKTLKRLFLSHPAAFAQLMLNLLKDYLQACQSANITPDEELLSPIIEKLKPFLK